MIRLLSAAWMLFKLASSCQVRLVINQSLYTLGGSNYLQTPSGADIAAPLSENFPPGRYNKAFIGALYFSSNSSNPCPTNLTAWGRALERSGLTTEVPQTVAPIRISPTSVLGITASQPQNFIGYEFNCSTTSVSVTPSGDITMVGKAWLLQGHIYSSSFLTGTRLDNVATSTNGTFLASGSISYEAGVLTLALSSFALTLVSVGSLDLQGTIYTTLAKPAFAGSMTLIGNTNCGNCGTFGQCLLQNTSYACVCDCGWANDADLGPCSLSTTACPSTLIGDSTTSFNFNGSSKSCGGASVSSPPLNEGSADIYRPIISFVPIMFLVLILLMLLIAMHKAKVWMVARKSYEITEVSRPGSLGCMNQDQRSPPFALEFEFSSVTNGKKTILQSMSGIARSGNLVGILGQSGSGKSTLLNILSGEIGNHHSWRVAGSVIKLGGKSVSQQELSQACAYVPQQLQLPLMLTVEEAVAYSAGIQLGADGSASEARRRVVQTLEELGISHIRHSFTGSSDASSGGQSSSWFGSKSSSISGGERLRVAIGMEIVTDKKILVLDEPTSGLDSYNAINLLQLLSCVAGGRDDCVAGVRDDHLGTHEAKRPHRPCRVVIVSLHQPSSSLFKLLDRVMLLASKGYLVYSGSPAEASRFFDSLGLPAPSDLSIAEHMLMVTGNTTTLDLLVSKTQEAASIVAVTKTDEQPYPAEEERNVPVSLYQSWALSWRKAGILFWRTASAFFRNPSLIIFHCVGAAALGLLVGFVFFRITVETTAGTTGRLGTLFFSINIVALTSLSAIEGIIDDRPVSSRELLRAYYSPSTYINIKLALDGLFLRVVPAVIYGTLFYWLAGMRSSASAFSLFLGVLASFNALVGGVVVFLTIVLSSSGRTLIAAATFILIGTLFAGFLAPETNMTWVLRWICYVSPFRWAWQALVVNEVRPLTLTLAVADLPSLTGYPGGLFLSSLGIDPTQLTTDVIVLTCEYFIVHFLCILALYLKVLTRGGG